MRTYSKLVHPVLLSFVAAFACRPDDDSHAKKIIGTESRAKAVTIASQIGEAVGSLTHADEHICMAFANSDGTVKTAAHCLHNNGSSGLVFTSIAGASLPVKSVLYVDDALDIAVLAVPGLGRFLEETPLDPNREITAFTHDIVNGGYFSETSNTFLVSDDLPGAVLHGLDTEPGSSGTPLIQGIRVVAVHVISVPNTDWNLAVNVVHSDAGVSPLSTLDFDWRLYTEDPTGIAKGIQDAMEARLREIFDKQLHEIEKARATGHPKEQREKARTSPECSGCHANGENLRGAKPKREEGDSLRKR